MTEQDFIDDIRDHIAKMKREVDWQDQIVDESSSDRGYNEAINDIYEELGLINHYGLPERRREFEETNNG